MQQPDRDFTSSLQPYAAHSLNVKMVCIFLEREREREGRDSAAIVCACGASAVDGRYRRILNPEEVMVTI